MSVSPVTHQASSTLADPLAGEVRQTLQDSRVGAAAQRGFSILARGSCASLTSVTSYGISDTLNPSPSPWGPHSREASSLLGGASPSPYTPPDPCLHRAPHVADLMDLLTVEGSQLPGAKHYAGDPIAYISSLFPTPKHKSL
ncbi:MAG: hypothetical protein JSR76_01975 [Verrucomicrobia bacterium]|nr:hypothetical protein [Verrucomicrobiota bacterium]